MTGWTPGTVEVYQLALQFPDETKPSAARAIDWERFAMNYAHSAMLPSIISVSEAARRLDVDARLLYQHANKGARVLAER